MIKKLFSSIYTRFMAIFIGVFFVTMLVSFLIISGTKLGDLSKAINNQMNGRVKAIKLLVYEKGIPVEDAVSYFEATDIYSKAYKGIADLINKEEVSLNKIVITKLKNQMGWVYTNNDFLIHPYTIAHFKDYYIFSTPNVKNNPFLIFGSIIRAVFLLSVLIGTILIAFAVTMIVKPIKAITRATKSVAEGQFDVILPAKGYDEIAELSRNFNIMAEELKANEYLHKDFVSSVSHEFKTPIASLKGFAKLLKDKTITEDKKEEYADIIISESDRLSRLSSNLLKLSELDNQVIEHNKVSFAIDEQIRRVLLLLQEKWESKELELDLKLSSTNYTGDEELIQLVWINLIGNAIKFTPPEGKITIKLEGLKTKNTESSKVLVTISDTGYGIAKEDIGKVFDRFYTGDKSRVSGGTGLGLSIVKKIVERHKGRIWVESISGVGTSVYVEL